LARSLEQLMDLFQTDVLSKLPVNGISAPRRLRVVHAVEKPLQTPLPLRMKDGRWQIEGVRVLPQSAAAASDELADDMAWSTKVEKAKEDFVKLAADHDIGGNKLYFCGALTIDRASTDSVRVEGVWPDLNHAVAIRRRVESDGSIRYVDDPPLIDRPLFEVNGIPRDGAIDGPQMLNLTKDEKNHLRALTAVTPTGDATFADGTTAAMDIDLRIIATSRFKGEFEPLAAGKPDPEGRFEKDSRRRFGVNGAGRVDEERILVRIPATSRPSKPVVTRVEWMAPEQVLTLADASVLAQKAFVPRLYLDKSWRASGQHELLAVVLGPNDLVAKRPYDPQQVEPATPFFEAYRPLGDTEQQRMDDVLRTQVRSSKFPFPFPVPSNGAMPPKPIWECAIDQASATDQYRRQCELMPEAVRQLITRWGADAAGAPIGKLEAYIHPGRFGGWVASMPNLQLPLPGSAANVTSDDATVRVATLLYKPQLDPETGEWYVDLIIDPGPAHAPFVKLSLARYQPFHLADPGGAWDLALSEPLLYQTPLRVPASRRVEVHEGVNDHLVVHVSGAGPLRREPFGINDAVRHITDHPVQKICLRRLPRAGDGPVQVYDRDGKPVIIERVLAQPWGAGLSWIANIPLPKDIDRSTLVLSVDEYEMHVPDSVIDGASSNALTASPADLIERPSFFSMTVPVPKLPEPEGK